MHSSIRTLPLLALLLSPAVRAQAPQLINYEGRVAVGGVNFKGAGQFKFALVDVSGTTSHWSNDGTSMAGSEPVAAVTLTVTKGHYAVLLGDVTLRHMTCLPAGVMAETDLRLRVWFSDGIHGSQLLTPDHRLASPPHAAAVSARGLRTGGALGTTDAWQQRAGGVPATARHGHTVVWTGGEMIIWGGYDGGSSSLNDGARYNPVANSWTAVTTLGAPTARLNHTAVWTGNEMIIWGGYNGNLPGSDSARYDPATDRWTAVSPTGAPAVRFAHTAVWTGSEMIVWGGTGSLEFNDGGRYYPAGNSWEPLNLVGAPVARYSHTAIWTGSEMIVWGGLNFDGYLDDGGRYNPAGDTWAAVNTTGAPTARWFHTAVWTGSEMIVWGGLNGLLDAYFNDGGRYNPTADAWTPVNTNGAPAGRESHTAVWTGGEMIVWGGSDGGSLRNGARYNPVGNNWSGMSLAGAPAARRIHTAIWTGTQMVVWGGLGTTELNDGGRYTPGDNSWRVTVAGAPAGRLNHTAVWTGSEMIVWGGVDYTPGLQFNDGGRYTPAANSWTTVATVGAPLGGSGHTAIWTGGEMIVWGGFKGNGDPVREGGRYRPAGDTWTPLPTTGAPSARAAHSAVWTGSEMIIWGGATGGPDGDLENGGRYQLATDTWIPMSTLLSPEGRHSHTAVWTGTEMIVWGGIGGVYFGDGGRYRPSGNEWTGMNLSGAPAGRVNHTAVWTGSEMIIWGGTNGTLLNDGRRYNPATSVWAPLSTVGAPAARQRSTGVWTGSEMIIWGGSTGGPLGSYLNNGSRYSPDGDTWTEMTTTGAPGARAAHTAVWTESGMIVWGGNGGSYLTDTFTYTPGQRDLQITSIVRAAGTLTITFPTANGRIYSLWRSDTLVDGSWTNTGLSALVGTGEPLAFTLPEPGPPATRFFRVQEK